MCAAFYYEKSGPNFVIGASLNEPTSLPYAFDKRHYKKDSRFVNDLYTLTYDDHESLDSVRLFSTFANQVSDFTRFRFNFFCLIFLSCEIGDQVLCYLFRKFPTHIHSECRYS